MFIYNVDIIVNCVKKKKKKVGLKLDSTTWDHRGPMAALRGMTQEVPLPSGYNAN